MKTGGALELKDLYLETKQDADDLDTSKLRTIRLLANKPLCLSHFNWLQQRSASLKVGFFLDRSIDLSK